jgi:hypothetical protein
VGLSETDCGSTGLPLRSPVLRSAHRRVSSAPRGRPRTLDQVRASITGQEPLMVSRAVNRCGFLGQRRVPSSTEVAV